MRGIVYALLMLVYATASCKSVIKKDGIRNVEDTFKMMEEIKTCYKAARDLQDDPSDGQKTSEFLKACGPFLKDITITDVQKRALERIGYKIEDLVGDKGITVKSTDGKDAKVSEKTKTSKKEVNLNTEKASERKILTDTSKAGQKEKSELLQNQATVPNSFPGNTKDKGKESNAFEKKQTQQEVVKNADGAHRQPIIPPQNVPLGQHPHVQHAAPENTFNQHIPIAEYQQGYQQPSNFMPSNHHDMASQGGIPVQAQDSPELYWNQQAGLLQQQMQPHPDHYSQLADAAFLNDMLLRARQGMDLLQPGNVPVNKFQGNAFMPDQLQNTGFNPQAAGFGGQDFFPQGNIPPEAQVWDGEMDYGFVDQQNVRNVYPPNEVQNPNRAQPDPYFVDHFNGRVEL